jgi:antitoxin (DNA-binding transcriptional repressor) of toxin-antitoxin stability system
MFSFSTKLNLAKSTGALSMASPVFNIHQAKSTLSKLIENIESGVETEIIFARNGKPAARLVPLIDKKTTGVRLGIAEHLYPNFDFETFQSLDAKIADIFLTSEIEPK